MEPEGNSMTLSAAPTLRRGSTPLPIKHQLRREEAVNEDCDWAPGLDAPSSTSISFGAGPEESTSRVADGSQGGPLRIVLLGQNGVGKSSLALALAGELDRSASVDSDSQTIGDGYTRTVTVDEEESTIVIYDNWKQGGGVKRRIVWTAFGTPASGDASPCPCPCPSPSGNTVRTILRITHRPLPSRSQAGVGEVGRHRPQSIGLLSGAVRHASC